MDECLENEDGPNDRQPSRINDQMRAFAANLTAAAAQLGQIDELMADKAWAEQEIDKWWRESKRLEERLSMIGRELWDAKEKLARRDVALKKKRNEAALLKRKLRKLTDQLGEGESDEGWQRLTIS